MSDQMKLKSNVDDLQQHPIGFMRQLDEFKRLQAEITELLQKNHAAFKQQQDEFKWLQVEIAELELRANIDPVACGKLMKLEAMMKSGGEALRQQITDKVSALEKTFTQLGKQLKQLAPEGDVNASVSAKPEKKAPAFAKKNCRTFV